jgi:UDPglucose--hexose-1-phosphate uridylyltransferase
VNRPSELEVDSETRVDPLTGRTVVISRHRQHRPNLPSDDCPFCPGGLEAPDPYDVRCFDNRWPSMPDGRCQIVLYTPDHDASLVSLGIEGALRVVELWSARTSALGARPEIAYVLVFENRGAEVGATISHPHGQIYAYDTVPDNPRRELELDDCSLCDDNLVDELVVSTVGDWRAWVPAAAAWPYELLVAPRRHVGDLPEAAPTHRDAAALLVDTLGRLDALFDAPMPYMLWIHQRPTDGAAWPRAHLHVHIAPFYRAPGTPRYVAAGELGSGTFFNPVAPEVAGEHLRRAQPQP